MPNATTGSGIATLSYDDKGTVSTTDDAYSFSIFVSGLTRPASGFHIHAPAAAVANGPIIVNLQSAFFSSGVTNDAVLVGGINVFAPNATFLSNLQTSLAYVNIHTAAFAGGEIRGQLVPVTVVPEPSSLAMLLASWASAAC